VHGQVVANLDVEQRRVADANVALVSGKRSANPLASSLATSTKGTTSLRIFRSTRSSSSWIAGYPAK